MHSNNQITSFDNCYINPTLDSIIFIICSCIVILSIYKRFYEYIHEIAYNPIILIEMPLTFISYKILCK